MEPNKVLEKMLHDFERHKGDLEKQMKSFIVLQNEVQEIVEKSSKSDKDFKKLERLQQLEQSEEYINLREGLMHKLEQLEEHFGQLERIFDQSPPPTKKQRQAGKNSTIEESKPLRIKRRSSPRFI